MDRCSVSTICDDIVRLHQLIAYNLHDCNTSALDTVYLSLAITSCIAKVESMITSSVSCGVSVYDLISSLKPNNYVSDITSIVPLSVPLGDCITSSETTSRKRSFDAVEENSSNSSSTHFSEKLQEKDFVVPEVSTPVVDEEIKSEQYVLNSATVPSISSFDMDLNDNSRKVKKKPIIRFNGAQHDSLLPLSLIPCDDVMAEITQLDTVIHDRDKDLRYMALATMFDLDFSVMASLYGYCSEHCEKVYNRLISAHNWTNDQVGSSMCCLN